MKVMSQDNKGERSSGKSLMPTQTAKIEFFRHDLGQAELDSVAEVLAGPILTTGETVARFERRFAAYLGRKHALGVTSCTGALHLSLLALGVGPGDEVITSPMTFIATATAILEAGATPVFVDVEAETGNLDARRIESAITQRTRAIMPVHLYGQMCDMRAIRKVADHHKLYVIEDAAHCVEGEREGVRPGELGETACFSFYATKTLTCGEGGAIVTDSDALAERLRLLRLHGMNKTAADRFREGYSHWDMVLLGWKYNMDNIQAALLLPQMDRLEQSWQRREALARSYEEALGGIKGLSWPKVLPESRHARYQATAWVEGYDRDELISHLREMGISAMVNYRAIHLLTYFRETFGYKPGDFPIAERIGETTLSLPFYATMPPEHVEIVADALRDILGTAFDF
jgi:dTDP-4-amino-4,6-dideoxygalactose transaminase